MSAYLVLTIDFRNILIVSLEQKDPIRVAAGLKAAIHNPNVSEEAKSSANERLHEMGTDSETKG